MESQIRRFEVKLGAKMLPCATICQTEHLKSLALGTFWLPSKLQTHSIASTRQHFILSLLQKWGVIY